MFFRDRGELKSLVAAANVERDRKNWNMAADLYAKYLDQIGRSARTFGVMVQLGNCLKEAERYKDSLLAYDEAVKVNKNNADLWLQRGHLFKLMRNSPAAAYAYQRSYNLNPNYPPSKKEIEASGALARQVPDLSEINHELRTIWLDVSDFLIYAKHNTSVSGIQRVIANLGKYIKNFSNPGWRIIPVAPEYDIDRILAVHVEDLIKIISIYDEPSYKDSAVKEAVARAYDRRIEVYPFKGDILCIPGAFWILPNYDSIIKLKQNGVRFCLFVHDLLQIRAPEYVAKDATDKFHIQMSDASEIADVILTNSHYVAFDVKNYLEETKEINIPVEAVVLPTELGSNQKNTGTSNKDILFLSKKNYVLSVSTIEIRKNYPLLISVWESLREELGDNAPYLVIIGKWGWQIDEFRKYIEEKGYLGDWLFIFNGISDVEMEILYKNCMFTVYPSFAEGFGLPIGESLAYGRPCIASNTTSMPEVGGDFVRYIDPYDAESAFSVIRHPIVDQSDLKDWQSRIQNEFKPKRWSEFCEEFYGKVIEFGSLSEYSNESSFVFLPPRRLINGGDHDILIRAGNINL